MPKTRKMIDYGTNPTALDFDEKGTLVALDSFSDTTKNDLQRLFDLAEQRKFAKVVLFPHNEKTLKAMDIAPIPAFHKRVKQLEATLAEINTTVTYTIDRFEERRKKYTPMELLLRYLQETYKAPFFLYLSDDYANRFATFASFETCLQTVRLLIVPHADLLPHPKLVKHKNRWETI